MEVEIQTETLPKVDVNKIIEENKDVFKNIFDKFGIKAPVSPVTVRNAMAGIPSLKNAVLNTFKEDFEGNKDGKEDDFTIEYDAVTGEEKKVKRKKIMKDVFGFAKDTIQNQMNKGSNPMTNEPTPKEETNEPTAKDGKKIFGMPPVLFGALCFILLLVVIALILKFKK